MSKFYSDQGPEKPGAYDPIKYGLKRGYFPALELVEIDPRTIVWRQYRGRTVHLVFWKPLLDELRRPRIEKETNA